MWQIKPRRAAPLLLAIAILPCVGLPVGGQEQTATAQDRSLQLFASLGKNFLIEPVELDLYELSVMLQDKLAADCEIDREELKLAGMTASVKIKLAARDRSLASALSVALKPLGLGWTIRNESLLITSLEIANEVLVAIPYDVSDLVEVPESLLAFAQFKSGEAEELIEQLESHIAPDDWENVGGPGLSWLKRTKGGMELIVSQSWHNQLLVQSFFSQLRANKQASQTADPPAVGKPFVQLYPLTMPEDFESAEMIRTIKEVVVEDWSDSDCDALMIGKGLVVKQTWGNQLRIRELLEGIGAIQRPSTFGWGFGGLSPPVGDLGDPFVDNPFGDEPDKDTDH